MEVSASTCAAPEQHAVQGDACAQRRRRDGRRHPGLQGPAGDAGTHASKAHAIKRAHRARLAAMASAEDTGRNTHIKQSSDHVHAAGISSPNRHAQNQRPGGGMKHVRTCSAQPGQLARRGAFCLLRNKKQTNTATNQHNSLLATARKRLQPPTAGH